MVSASAAHASGRVPLPDQGQLQYPIYESRKVWERNLLRLSAAPQAIRLVPMRDLDLPAPEDDFDAKLLADVRERGWHCVLVADEHHPHHRDAAAAPEPHPLYDATFGYTVGLGRREPRHPELVLVGRWPHPEGILAAAVALIEDGAAFAAGDETDEVLDGYPVRFAEVAASRRDELLGYARWAHGGRSFEALQLVLPDREGRWPWEDGYDACPQPLLAPADVHGS